MTKQVPDPADRQDSLASATTDAFIVHQRLIGQILVDMGVLRPEQVEAILEDQLKNRRPFGLIASEMFGVDRVHLWKAWARQIEPVCLNVDLAADPFDASALKLLSPEEAWLLCALPLRLEGTELVVATARHTLPDAVAALQDRFGYAIHYVLADRDQIEQFLMQRYGQLYRLWQSSAKV